MIDKGGWCGEGSHQEQEGGKKRVAGLNMIKIHNIDV
jgi:hypothetical protein